ncbi:MAG TPA: peptidoglycan DD-metalloendopeptidase family protein [Acidimicrobiales bacterium]
MRAGITTVARRGRPRRWSALLAGAVVLAGAVGGIAAAAGAQSGGQPPVPPEPPADNVFPVPLPYEVSFDDTWHACRDDCARRHKGNDLMADEGVPAVAVEAGVIAKVDDTDDGRGGLSVWLLGDSGVAYYYAHNSQNLVAEGDRVARGQMIARVGRTGNARTTPPHIHFQINLCGELSSDEPCTVDPHPYLRTWSQGQIGGGIDGVGWYLPAAGAFEQRTEAGSPLPPVALGEPGDGDSLPLAGDWDGDGRDSPGIYRPADATFRLLDDEGGALEPLSFGEPGRDDVWPVAGDFDGDGRDTVGLYRQADATFVVLVDQGAESAPVALGEPGRADALPVVGDWDGEGRDSVGVYHQADGTVALLDDDGTALEPATAGAGGAGSFPVAGDWDGDGSDAVGVLRRDAAAVELPVPEALDPEGVRTVALDGAEVDGALPVAGDWNGQDLVTLAELRQIYGEIPDEATVAEGLPGLNAAMLRAGISTPARKAAFLATVRNESEFRYDAVEHGNDSRYRGRGFIQLTGMANYRSAGDFLGIDLAGEPDLALDGLASPAVAAWYWTVARDINAAADALDMAAVNIAVGFAPSVRRDTLRCGDFVAALRYYRGGDVPEGVNCERTAEAQRRALAPLLPFGFGDDDGTAPSGGAALAPGGGTQSPAAAAPASSRPAAPAPASGGARPPSGSSAPQTAAAPAQTTTPTAPPTTAPPTTARPTTTAAPATTTSVPTDSSTETTLFTGG